MTLDRVITKQRWTKHHNKEYDITSESMYLEAFCECHDVKAIWIGPIPGGKYICRISGNNLEYRKEK